MGLPVEVDTEIRALVKQVLVLRDQELRARQEVVRRQEEGRELVTVSIPSFPELASRLRELVGDDPSRRPLLAQYQLLRDRYVVFLLPLWRDLNGEDLPLRHLLVPRDEVKEERIVGLVNAGLAAARRRTNGRIRGGVTTLEKPAATQETTGVDPVSSTPTDGKAETSSLTASQAFAALLPLVGEVFVQPWLNALPELGLDATELILVPEGYLHVLPLHAASIDGEGTPLLGKYPLVYVSSANLAQTLLKRKGERPMKSTAGMQGGRLVMGPGDDSLPHAVEKTLDLSRRWRLDRPCLPTNRRQPFAFERMTVDVWRAFAGQIDVLHLATHSSFNFDDYLRSSIHFHDGPLTLFELLSDHRLHSPGLRLCYLSSCESGLARPEAGDELQGLVWGLIYAGARAVMASLWPVLDEAAYQMARQFNDHLDDGCTLIEAYRNAVDDLRSGRCGDAIARDPYAWAPFVLFGDGWND